MSETHGQWEYYVEYISADIKQNEKFAQLYYGDEKPPKYAIQFVLPRLNQLGAMGWELVEMQPVKVGTNGDIMVADDQRQWSNTFLCVFKRLAVPSNGSR